MAGIINPLKCGLDVKISEINNDLNNLTTPGIYNFIDTTGSVSNNPGVNYGMMIVLKAYASYTMQIAFDSSNRLWVRFLNPSQSMYKSWTEL